MAAKKCFAILPMYGAPRIMGNDNTFSVQDKKEGLFTFYYRKEDAIAKAIEEASKNPRVPYLILESTTVVEAKKPEVLTKEFKDNGELLPKSEMAV